MIKILIEWPDTSLEPTPVAAGSFAVPPSSHFGATSAVGVASLVGSVPGRQAARIRWRTK